jgi:DNA-repair protein XRCC1
MNAIRLATTEGPEAAGCPASNLVTGKGAWRVDGKRQDGSRASVLFDLVEPSLLTGVELVNAGSAFVEVLVGKSSWPASEQFQVLLPVRSLGDLDDVMTGNLDGPFRSTALSESVKKQRWDRVRIVCSQPYAPTSNFGLASVKLLTEAVIKSFQVRCLALYQIHAR